MDFHSARRILYKYTEEFYQLDSGTPISNPQEKFSFQGIVLLRQPIKHVVERRKMEKKSIEEIKRLFTGALKTIENFDFEILNTNQTDYPGSVMKVKAFPEWKRGLIVVLGRPDECERRIFITAFFCHPKRMFLLQKKKLQ